MADNRQIPTETVSCGLCRSEKRAVLYEIPPFAVARCSDCGLVYASPRPAAAALKETVYDEGYFNAEKGFGLAGHFDRGGAEARRRAGELLAWVEKRAPAGGLLDVGCAGGFFLETAARRGWKASGIEISAAAAAHARNELGLDVAEGDFASADFRDASFDVITMFDVVEHLPSPVDDLKRAHSLLRHGGRLFLVTPNFDSLARRAHGAAWGLLEPEHHLFYFNRKTLRAAVEAAGFKIEETFFREIGIADLLLSAGTLNMAGVKIDGETKGRLRKTLGGLRAPLRKLAAETDKNLLRRIFPAAEGVAIYMEAVK